MNQSISTIRDIKISCYLDECACVGFTVNSFKEANSKFDERASILEIEEDEDIEFFVEVNYTDDIKHSYSCYGVKSLKMLLASYDTFYSIYRLIGKKKGK